MITNRQELIQTLHQEGDILQNFNNERKDWSTMEHQMEKILVNRLLKTDPNNGEELERRTTTMKRNDDWIMYGSGNHEISVMDMINIERLAMETSPFEITKVE